MTEIEIDAGTLEFSDAGLTATGLLIPFGEECRSNLGRFTVDENSFTIPTDLTGASLNLEHEREAVVGGLTTVTKSAKGYLGTFSFADTDEGRAAYADAKAGKRKNLSAEVANVVIRGGRAVAGRLFAAALVRRPAFPSATLLAAAPDTTTPTTDPQPLTPDADDRPSALDPRRGRRPRRDRHRHPRHGHRDRRRLHNRLRTRRHQPQGGRSGSCNRAGNAAGHGTC